MAFNQIEQREQENPDDINEVPVQTDVFNGRIVVGIEAAFAGFQNQPEKQARANDHVQGVQAGHAKIEREIELGVGVEGSYSAFCFDSLANFLHFIVERFAANAAR